MRGAHQPSSNTTRLLLFGGKENITNFKIKLAIFSRKRYANADVANFELWKQRLTMLIFHFISYYYAVLILKSLL